MTFVGLISGALLVVGIFAWLVFGSSIADGGLMVEMAGALFGILGAICVSTFLIVRRLSQILGKIESIQEMREGSTQKAELPLEKPAS
ncbi:MAG: hypothetical protein OXM87_11745 [Truepera sp.]|nr:hypothetical protein [Truepera sp.]